ncbi:MAG TPA: hypothetical protein DCM87_02585 [Planctomycetes bacterium]|nr:hypothetical protein [Planctomycetota bacterium]
MRRASACIAALLVSMSVLGGQAEFADEFNAGVLDPAWEWYTPAPGPVYELDGVDFILDVPMGNYDSWVGFDRAPRLRTARFETGADFRIETHVIVEVPAGPQYYQTGLWVGFKGLDGDVIDGWFYGFYSQPDWVGNYTIRAERVGNRSAGAGSNFPLPWGFADAHFKVERIGDLYSFHYKEGAADAWILFHSVACAGQAVIDVGLFAKNWAADAAIRARFDYFRLGDPASVAPAIDPVPDDRALAGLAYCKTIVPRQGYPAPAWSLEVVPAPAAAPAIDAGGRVTWTPAAADGGATYTFTATAANAGGSASAVWEVAVGDALRDDFDGPDLAPGFDFYTPQTGPTLVFDGGFARLHFEATGDDGLNYDTWTGFDRMPRIQAPLATCGDFAIETVLTVVEPAGVSAYFHGGLWVGFAGGGVDGVMWGPYMSAAQLRLERMGVNMPQTQIATSGAAELALRIERRGDAFVFSYRDGPDGAWIDHWTQAFAGVEVGFIGAGAKNYGGGVAVTFDFDYLYAETPEPKAPVLENPCPDSINTTTAGSLFAKRLAYRAGTPLPTAIEVAGPGAFDPATGLYTVVPDAAGPADVTITATMAGMPPAAVSFRVTALARTTHFEDFELDDIEEIAAPWELYNPAMIDPPPFAIAGGAGMRGLQLHTDAGTAYDHWAGIDNAPQCRAAAFSVPELAGDFTAEAKLTLLEYNPFGAPEPFHTGVTVVFGTYELYYWGFLNGTDLVLERSGVNRLAVVANASPTVTLRVRRECGTYYFLVKPEGGEWQLASVQAQPPEWGVPPAYVGLILKTYGGTGATVTVECEYFDIFAAASDPGEPRFRRGDVNQDGKIDIADPITLLGHLFTSKPLPACPDSADGNDDGKLDIADAIKILGHLFASTGALPAPFDACGPDPQPDALPVCVFDPAKCP